MYVAPSRCLRGVLLLTLWQWRGRVRCFQIHVDAFLVVMAANAILFGGGGYFVKMYSAEDDDYSAF